MLGLRQQEITANNMANAQTPGFKISRLVSRDTVETGRDVDNYMRQRELQSADEVHVDWSNGPLIQTGNPLDVALRGDGFLAISTPDGDRYLRTASLKTTDQGELVDGTGSPRPGPDRSAHPPAAGRQDRDRSRWTDHFGRQTGRHAQDRRLPQAVLPEAGRQRTLGSLRGERRRPGARTRARFGEHRGGTGCPGRSQRQHRGRNGADDLPVPRLRSRQQGFALGGHHTGPRRQRSRQGLKGQNPCYAA
jgi:hypothetical protein